MYRHIEIVDDRTYTALELTREEAEKRVLAQLNAHIERLQEAAAKLKGETPHQPELPVEY